MNEAQKSVYGPNTGGWRRSQALASVVLDFETDATELRYETEKYPANRVVDCSGFVPRCPISLRTGPCIPTPWAIPSMPRACCPISVQF